MTKTLGPARLVIIDYTNWRGERAKRLIHPIRLEFDSNEWHPVPQWLLFAYDIERAAYRVFAMAAIHSWEDAS